MYNKVNYNFFTSDCEMCYEYICNNDNNASNEEIQIDIHVRTTICTRTLLFARMYIRLQL